MGKNKRNLTRVTHTEEACDKWISKKKSRGRQPEVTKMRALFGNPRVRNPMVQMEYLSQPVEIKATRQASLTSYFKKQYRQVSETDDSHYDYSDLQSSAESHLPHVLTVTNHNTDNQVTHRSANKDVVNEIRNESLPPWSHSSSSASGLYSDRKGELDCSELHRQVEMPKRSNHSTQLRSLQVDFKENCDKREQISSCEVVSQELRSPSHCDGTPPRLSLCTYSPLISRPKQGRKLHCDHILQAFDVHSPVCERRLGQCQESKTAAHRCTLDRSAGSGSPEYSSLVSPESLDSRTTWVKTTKATSTMGAVPVHVHTTCQTNTCTEDKSDAICLSSSQDSLSMSGSSNYKCSHEYSADGFADEYTLTATQRLTNRMSSVQKAVEEFKLNLKLQENHIRGTRQAIDSSRDVDSESQPFTFHIADESCFVSHDEDRSCNIPITFHVAKRKCFDGMNADFDQPQIFPLSSPDCEEDSQLSPLTFH